VKAHFKRYFGYTFWVALEVVVFTGLSRLVIFPVAAHLLGKEQFGLFIFSLGIALMLGAAPSVGLATGVIRHMAELEASARGTLVSTSIRLCKIAMLLIVLIGIIALGIVRYFSQTDPKIIWCIVPLLILLYPWNILELQLVQYRVGREFALRTAWYSVLSMLSFIAIPAAIFGGAVGMAWGYMLGFVVTHILLSWKQKILFKRSNYDAKLAGLLKKIWLHISIASILSLSGRYIYRLVLGIFYSYSTVAIFFGATNILDLCMAPMGILSQLLLSMLSGFSRLEDVGKRQRYTVLAAAVSIGVVGPLIVLLAGPFILSVIFPDFANESTQILRWLVMVMPCLTVEIFSKPFVIKFGPIKFVPVLNFITLMGHLVPAITLIPKFGIMGAAVSYNIGYSLSAASWLGALLWTFKFSHKYKSDIEMLRSVEGG